MVVLVSKLAENRETETKEAASIAYAEKLKPFHGWVSSSAFSVVLQFPPARKGFVENLGGEMVLETDGKELVEKFGPVLKRIDDFLTKEDLNDPSKGIKRWNHEKKSNNARSPLLLLSTRMLLNLYMLHLVFMSLLSKLLIDYADICCCCFPLGTSRK